MSICTVSELHTDEYVEKLHALAAAHAEQYQKAEPFPSIWFDNFLPPSTAERALDAFPSPEAARWFKFDNKDQKKLADNSVERLPDATRDVLYFLNSPPFLKFLETLTGITHLIPDPYYVGGGLHQIVPGGFLQVHADFSWNHKLKLDRRINVLIYMNKDWEEEYGGHFELWDQKLTGAVKKILPVFNRCAIFNTTRTSYHGHPNPLACPADRTRKSIATYYYTNGRPDEEASEAHGTLFKHERDVNGKYTDLTGRDIARMFVPPIVLDTIRHMKKTKKRSS